ncbi:phosphatase PAP2 family protein [Acidimangrovimonas sediminis]|uniref:phosphatase PAP2 family protein n=1 Tax=Acidimangrovimonas sediminis TaxID=2056283 RepID=UPI0011AFC62C|nr:phosphatase PAP2 family protein [Acidimangrovimonas sediminis]
MIARRALFVIPVALVGIVVSILWIDHPLARFFARFHVGHAVFTSSPVTLPVMSVLALAGLLLGVGYLVAGKTLPRWIEATMLAGFAVLAGQLLAHELLKPIFGRPVPSDYLTTGHHGFHWFHRGLRFGSFPSGHSVQASAMLSVAWAYYPRWRWLCATLMSLLAVALMLGQWHYLSDIIAGTTVGSLVGIATMAAWRRMRPVRRPA